MGRPTGAADTVPTGHHAPWALASLGAWLAIEAEGPVVDDLRELQRRHVAEGGPDADTAAVEAWAVLERHGARHAFEAWSEGDGRGWGCAWPIGRNLWAV